MSGAVVDTGTTPCYATGMILAIDPGTTRSAWAARFWSKVDKTGSCWLWTGSIRPDGYPAVWIEGRMVRAHRVAYEMEVGAIPVGLELDHLCRLPRCVNPAHLEPVTRHENMRRADTGWRTRKTHCVRGHPFDDVNTLRWRGWRLCRACRSVSARRIRERAAARAR